MAGRSLRYFVEAFWHVLEPTEKYQHNWHIDCLCEHLEAVTRLEIQRLIIALPPRHTKSVCTSICWPAWVWTFDPASRWLFGSYEQGLATDFSLKTRDVIRSELYRRLFGRVFAMRKDQDMKTMFWNDRTGSRTSVGVGGKGTGAGSTYQVADDPLKRQDARSAAARLKAIEWWTGTMATRVNNPAEIRRVVTHQRLHENDLIGYLIAADMGYETLILPAEYESGRVIETAVPGGAPRDAIVMTCLQRANPSLRDPRTNDGELLWKDRFDSVRLAELKRDIGSSTDVAAQLQQKPSPVGGSVFDLSLIRRFVRRMVGRVPSYALRQPDGVERIVPVKLCRYFQVADTAQKKGQDNDFTAVGTFAITPDRDLLLIHAVRARIEVPYQLRFLGECRLGPTRWDADARKAVRSTLWPKPLTLQGVEDASSGTGLIQTAAAVGIPLRALSPRGSKVEKAAIAATMYEAGRVYHPYPSDPASVGWSQWMESELASFPVGAHDDGVDVISMGCRLAVEDILLVSGWDDLGDALDDEGLRERDHLIARDEAVEEPAALPPVRVRAAAGDLDVDLGD